MKCDNGNAVCLGSSVVEHFIGNEEAGSSILLLSTIQMTKQPPNSLKIAVSKGALFEGAVKYLHAKGIKIKDEREQNSDKRKLILQTSIDNSCVLKEFASIEILIVRGHDVPIYVEHGAADLGIVGLDVVVDSKTEVLQLQGLDYGHCKLCVCGKELTASGTPGFKSLNELPSYTRVATTFPNITKDFFHKHAIDVEIIPLYGSVELGPLTELSDVIVDLVASGKTLKDNGLKVIDTIMDCSAVLIANKVSFKFYRQEFLDLTKCQLS